MSVETKTRLIETDPNSLYKTQKVRFSSDKSITTPTKSIPLDKLKVMHPLNPKSRQLNEIFKRFNAKQIKEANEDTDKYHQLETFFNAQKKKIKEGTITFCFLDFDETRLPNNEEMEFMTDLAYCNSDITTIPFINHFNKTKQTEISYEDYKLYLNSAIESIEQLNNKSIMGIIPRLAPKKVADLLDFYQDKGINSYALDLSGSNPMSASMRTFKVLKTLNNMNTLDESYIHAHNVGMRVSKMADIIPAKDVLGFGLGINSLGEKRTKFVPNRVFLEQIKINPLNKFRLFDKKDYGYWKAISPSEIEKIRPIDCSLEISLFRKLRNIRYVQTVFNAEQLALESHNLKEIINEDSEKPLEYIKNKKHVVSNDIKLIEKGKKKIK